MSILDRFIQFEKEHKLFEKEIQGVRLWPFIRLNLYRDILTQKTGLGKVRTKSSLKGILKILSFVKNISYYFCKNPMWGLKQKDLLVINSPRRVKNGDYFDCIYTDTFLEHLGFTYYVFEGSYQDMHFKPVRTANLLYSDHLSLERSIRIRAMKLLNQWKLSDHETAAIRSLIVRLNELFGCSLNYSGWVTRIQGFVRSYYATRNYMERLVDRIKPRLIIEVCSYMFNQMVLNEIAKKKNIKVIELQHGVIGREHVAYNFYAKMEVKTFPDYLFLYGDYWKENARFPIDDSRLTVTGFPYYEQKRGQFGQDHSGEGRKTVLFLSQGIIGEELSKIAVALSNKLDPAAFRIIYKLHPGEFNRWRKKYPWLENTSIDVVDNNEGDIYSFFHLSSYQVGVCSTAIFEGAGFDLQTIIVKLAGHEIMKHLYHNGYAALVSSADELADYIKRPASSKEDVPGSFFWQSNSIENITKALEDIYSATMKKL